MALPCNQNIRWLRKHTQSKEHIAGGTATLQKVTVKKKKKKLPSKGLLLWVEHKEHRTCEKNTQILSYLLQDPHLGIYQCPNLQVYQSPLKSHHVIRGIQKCLEQELSGKWTTLLKPEFTYTDLLEQTFLMTKFKRCILKNNLFYLSFFYIDNDIFVC